MHRYKTEATGRTAKIIGAVAVCILVFAGAATAETLRFGAALESEIAAMPKATGRGSALLSVDTESKAVTWKVEHSGLATSPRALGCGVVDTPTPSILVTNNLASPISGSKTLTDPEIAALKSGNWACVIDTNGEEDAIGGVLHAAR